MAVVIKGLTPKPSTLTPELALASPLIPPLDTQSKTLTAVKPDTPPPKVITGTTDGLEPVVFTPPPNPAHNLTKALELSVAPKAQPDTQDTLPPWEVMEGYSILDALAEHGTPARRGYALWLVHRHATGIKYLVKSWDSATNRAVLEGTKKSVMKPVISEREVPLYYPLWV